MKTVPLLPVLRIHLLGTLLLAGDLSPAVAQQASTDAGRSRLLRRLRDADPPARNQSNNQNNSKSSAQAANQAPPKNKPAAQSAAPNLAPRNLADGRSQAAANVKVPAHVKPMQPPRPGAELPSILHQGSQQEAFPRQPAVQNPATAGNVPPGNVPPGHVPAIRPPNRLPVPKLAPPLHQDTTVSNSELSNSEVQRHDFGMSLQDLGGKIIVSAVEPGRNADRDGIRNGDIIQSIGGVPVQTQQEFLEVAGLMQSGDQVEIVVERQGKEETLLLGIGTLPHSENTFSLPLNSNQDVNHQAGFGHAEAQGDDNGLWGLRLSDSGWDARQNPSSSNSFSSEDELHSSFSKLDEIRNSILRKEVEIRDLMQQVEALKRRLASLAEPQSF